VARWAQPQAYLSILVLSTSAIRGGEQMAASRLTANVAGAAQSEKDEATVAEIRFARSRGRIRNSLQFADRVSAFPA